MAHMRKYSHPVAAQILAHNTRSSASTPHATHIDSNRTHLNYSLLPDRGMTDYEYYKLRKSQLYCFRRSDVKTLLGWICTLPQGVSEDQEYNFFRATHDFYCQRYGEKNIVQSIVHKDEEGQPHLHVCMIPAVPDPKHGGEKICADSFVTRRDLMSFHTDLQRWLDECGISARVTTGISAVVGRNLSVEEIKCDALDMILCDLSFDTDAEMTPSIDWSTEVDKILSSLHDLEISANDSEYDIEW